MSETTTTRTTASGAKIITTRNADGSVKSISVIQPPSYTGVDTDRFGHVTRRYYGTNPSRGTIERVNKLAKRVEARETAKAQAAAAKQQAYEKRQAQQTRQAALKKEKAQARTELINAFKDHSTHTAPAYMQEGLTQPTSYYTPTKLSPEAVIQPEGAATMTGLALHTKGSDYAGDLAQTLAAGTGKRYRVFRQGETIGDKWVIDRVVGATNTKTAKSTKQAGKEIYTVTPGLITVTKNGKTINTIKPTGSTTKTRIEVTPSQYKIYRGGELIEIKQAPEGQEFDIGAAKAEFTKNNYTITPKGGGLEATFTEQPLFDLQGTIRAAERQGFKYRQENNKVVVEAPILTTTTTTNTGTTGRGYNFVIAREATPAEKWINKGNRRAEQAGKFLDNLPVVGKYFRSADILTKSANKGMDAAITRASKTSGDTAFLKIAGKAPLQAGVGAVFSPATITKGVISLLAKGGTVAEAALTKPAEFKAWTKTSVSGLPAAGRWVAEHPVEVTAAAAAIATSALIWGAAGKDLAKSLPLKSATPHTQATILSRQGGGIQAEIKSIASAKNPLANVKIEAAGTSNVMGTAKGLYLGDAQYTLKQTTNSLFGTKSLTFEAAQTATGAGAKVTAQPLFYGIEGDMPYSRGGLRVTLPTPDANYFLGMAKTTNSLGGTSIAYTAAKEFYSGGGDTVLLTAAKGIAKTGAGAAKFKQAGTLTVFSTPKTPTLDLTGVTGNSLPEVSGGGITATKAMQVDSAIASMAKGIEAMAQEQAKAAAITETATTTAKGGAILGTAAGMATKAATKQATSYKDILQPLTKLKTQTIELTAVKTRQATQPAIYPAMATKAKQLLAERTTRPSATQITQQIVRTMHKELTITAPLTAAKTRTKQAQVELTLTSTKEILPEFTTPTGMGNFEIPLIPIIPPAGNLGGAGQGNGLNIGMFNMQPIKYQPSVMAKMFDITAPKPEPISFGIGVRPIIKKRKRKK